MNLSPTSVEIGSVGAINDADLLIRDLLKDAVKAGRTDFEKKFIPAKTRGVNERSYQEGRNDLISLRDRFARMVMDRGLQVNWKDADSADNFCVSIDSTVEESRDRFFKAMRKLRIGNPNDKWNEFNRWLSTIRRATRNSIGNLLQNGGEGIDAIQSEENLVDKLIEGSGVISAELLEIIESKGLDGRVVDAFVDLMLAFNIGDERDATSTFRQLIDTVGDGLKVQANRKMRSTNAHLRRGQTQLQNQLTQAQADSARKDEELAALRKELEILKEAASADGEMDEVLQSTNQMLSRELAASEAELKKVRDELMALRKYVAVRDKKVGELRTELAAVHAGYNRLLERLKGAVNVNRATAKK